MDIGETIKQFAVDNKKTIGLYFLLSLAFPISEVVLPYYYGKIIEKTAKLPPERVFTENKRYFTIVVGLWAFNQVLYSSMDRLDTTFIPKLESYIRQNIVLKILRAYRGHYDDPEVGEMIAQVIKLPIVLRDIFHQIRLFIMPSILVLIFAVGYLLYVDLKLGMLAILGIMAFFILMYSFAKHCISLSMKTDEQHNRVCEEVCDLLSNMINIFAAGKEEEELKRFEKIQEEYDKEYRNAIGFTAKFKCMFNIFYFMMFVAINGYAFYLYSKKQIPVSSLTSILIIMLYVINHLGNMAGEIREFVFNVGVLKKTQESMDSLTPNEKAELEKTNFDITSGLIEFQGVEISRDGFTLKLPYIQIAPTQKVAIVGKVGSGKSTLIGGLMGYYSVTKGNILIDGKSTSGMDLIHLRKQIAYVPQTPRLFNRTVLENITYGTDASRQDVIDLLSQLGIDQIKPSDFDRKAGKNGSHVSGGQRQIIYLLRLILGPSKIVILDEPTASLDDESRGYVLYLIDVLSAGKTTLMVTHDPQLMKMADRYIRL